MPTDDEIAAGTKAVRTMIDHSGYGSFVSDGQCQEVAEAVLAAAERVRDAPKVDESGYIESHEDTQSDWDSDADDFYR
jgi:hypothetical protein